MQTASLGLIPDAQGPSWDPQRGAWPGWEPHAAKMALLPCPILPGYISPLVTLGYDSHSRELDRVQGPSA